MRRRPDRLALYGYAHVPHMSKRQVMIAEQALPDPEERYHLSQIARVNLEGEGFVPIGIDHFAQPTDSLAKAAKAGALRRNFQGYTDDPCQTLLGFGASAISRFGSGYAQNAVATAAYSERIRASGLAAHKGLQIGAKDAFVGAMIEKFLCTMKLNTNELRAKFPQFEHDIEPLTKMLMTDFPQALSSSPSGLTLSREFSAMARMIAARLDICNSPAHIHSLAI